MKSLFAVFIFFASLVAIAQDAQIAFTLSEKDLIPEGITYDSDRQTLIGNNGQIKNPDELSDTYIMKIRLTADSAPK